MFYVRNNGMALMDYLWLIRLIIEILRLVADLPEEDLRSIARLRSIDESEVT